MCWKEQPKGNDGEKRTQEEKYGIRTSRLKDIVIICWKETSNACINLTRNEGTCPFYALMYT